MNITRIRLGRKVVSLAAIAVITLAFTLAPSTRSAKADNAENVHFNGVAFTNDGVKVGFWIWCQPEGNSPVYTGACKGAMHLYGLDNAVAVQGFIIENPDGTYVARVFAKKATGLLLAAAFHNVNVEDNHGPNNVVQFGVLTADGVNRIGVGTDIVFHITGPGDNNGAEPELP